MKWVESCKVCGLLGSVAASVEAASSTAAVASSVASGGRDVTPGARRWLRYRGCGAAPSETGEGAYSALCIRSRPRSRSSGNYSLYKSFAGCHELETVSHAARPDIK